MPKHLETGKSGEVLATELLIKKGYTILERNYRSGKSEVDIIAMIGNELVFVEVKTRSTAYFGYPEESITDRKIELMSEAADNYIEVNDLKLEVRFDLISVILNREGREIYHVEDAFSG